MVERESDQGLLQKASLGNEAAFSQLYDRHADAVFRFIRRLLGENELAEDVTQECFLQLITKAPRYDPDRAAFRTYLLAIARNVAFRHVRANISHIVDQEFSEESEVLGREDLFQRLYDEEISQLVMGAIGTLPPLQREAVILLVYEELSLSEIATIVGADVGTVKSRLHRGREKLRRLLAPLFSRKLKAATLRGD